MWSCIACRQLQQRTKCLIFAGMCSTAPGRARKVLHNTVHCSHADVPEGKGVSSSAAVEVAAMSAVAAAYGIQLEGRELALLCQRVENAVVGELATCLSVA